jgi:hypothetical protein
MFGDNYLEYHKHLKCSKTFYTQIQEIQLMELIIRCTDTPMDTQQKNLILLRNHFTRLIYSQSLYIRNFKSQLQRIIMIVY